VLKSLVWKPWAQRRAQFLVSMVGHAPYHAAPIVSGSAVFIVDIRYNSLSNPGLLEVVVLPTSRILFTLDSESFRGTMIGCTVLSNLTTHRRWIGVSSKGKRML